MVCWIWIQQNTGLHHRRIDQALPWILLLLPLRLIFPSALSPQLNTSVGINGPLWNDI